MGCCESRDKATESTKNTPQLVIQHCSSRDKLETELVHNRPNKHVNIFLRTESDKSSPRCPLKIDTPTTTTNPVSLKRKYLTGLATKNQKETLEISRANDLSTSVSSGSKTNIAISRYQEVHKEKNQRKLWKVDQLSK